MTTTLTKHERYLEDFRALEQAADGSQPGWLCQLRHEAMARFEQLGFPTARRGNEKWKYTNIAPIADAAFWYSASPGMSRVKATALRRVAPRRKEWTTLVFVDGRYAPALSSVPSDGGGLRVASLAEAFHTEQGLVQQHVAKHAAFEDDGFAALNTAFLADGAFVHVAGGEVHAPVHLLFVATDSAQPQVSYPRTLVVTERNTKLTLVETYVGLGEGAYFNDAVTEVVVGDGSAVDHYKVTLESANAFHVAMTRATVGQDALFSTTAFAKGGALARHDLHMALAGRGSSCRLNGLHLTAGREHIDNHVQIDHAAPYSQSYQYVKGILTGTSHAVYTGRVLIRKGAVKSNAKQADKNLILSERAEVDTKPSMEIYCDDVKATHGATAGQIAEAEEQIFYMRSRGLDEKTAAALLIRGFAKEILDTVRLEPLRAFLDGVTDRALPEFQFEGSGG